MPLIHPYSGIEPKIEPTAFIAENAVVIGDVEIGSHANIWFGCVIRGDVHRIKIGARTNIQDGTIIHVTRGNGPTAIGAGITIGHSVLLHACTLEDDCFIGMRATVMDGAVVESGGMVAAGSLITPGKRVKSGQIWAGNPGKYFRDLTAEEAAFIAISAQNYMDLAEEYKRHYEPATPLPTL